MIINQTVRGFIRKEFLQVFKDPRMWAMLVFAPVFQLIMFGYALSFDVKNIRLKVVSAPEDFAMQDIKQRSLGSGYFLDVAGAVPNDPFDVIQYNKADAVLVAPPGGLTKAMGRGEGRVQLLLDASNVTKAQAVENYVTAITGLSVVRTVGSSIGQATAARGRGLELETRVLYNPSMRSAVFMVPGVLGLLTCLLPILLTAMALSKEKEDGTFEMLLASSATPMDIIMGKTIPYVILGFAHLPFTIPVAYFVFGVPIRGSILLLLLAFFIFISVTVSCGVLISTVTRTQQQSMMGGFMFIFPSIMLSGMMFPIENMPAFMRVLAHINPLTYFLRLLRNIMLKGGDPWLVGKSMLILLLIAIVVVLFTFKRFKTTIS